MDFEDFTVAEKPTTLQQLKKLDEERTKLMEGAKLTRSRGPRKR
jgi:hypothetical protein